ncbi:cytochrome P450 [Cerioporus squamosus]|nr:cytochrome P450 [Cerioporus squamosus]
MDYPKISHPEVLWAATVLCAVAAVSVLLRRLFFHPLSRFPGPKLAAATWWYMTYYEVFKDGAFIDHLNYLHAHYSTAAATSYILHFSEPKAYNNIYVNGHRFTKDPRVYQALHQDECSLCIIVLHHIDLRESKMRRDILSPLFSRRAILKLEHVILSKVDTLTKQLCQYVQASTPVNFRRAIRSTALEVIYAYCFASDEDFIVAPDFSHKFIVEAEMVFPFFFVVVHFSWIFRLLGFQSCVAAWFRPQKGVMMDSYGRLRGKIDELVAHPELLDKEDHDTIFHHLLMPHPEKGQSNIPFKKALWEEAVNLLAAGGESVAGIMTFGAFHILSSPPVYERLSNELKAAWPDKETTMHYETLEKLPYLTAVIKESLRIGQGVVVPSGRVVGPTDASIAGVTVPAGAVVTMGSTVVHLNPTIFPEPHKFDPERWLGADKGNLEQYLVAFAKGPRACLGINLGWCELYLLFGHIFRKFELELYNTTAKDMEYHCHMTPTVKGRMLHCQLKVRSD